MTAPVAIRRSTRIHWTAADLLAESFPEPRWAVPGLLAEGVNLFAGQPKVGKSWAALNLAVSVASGGKALGRIDVQQGPVLYLALEDTARRLADRLRKVIGDDGCPDALDFVTSCPPIDTGGAERIGEWLSAHPGARLVVVDVLARIRPRSNDTVNAYASDYAALGAFTALAERHRVSILVVHHTRKAASDDYLNEVSGTNGLAGAADATLVLKRMRGSADAELHVTGRDIMEQSYALNFDAARGVWHMLDGQVQDYTLSDSRKSILDGLRAVQGATPKQLATSLSLPYETVKKTCRRMADDGQIDTDGQGLYFPLGTVPGVPAVPHTLSLRDTGDIRDTHTGDVA